MNQSGHERRYWIIPRVMVLIWGTRSPQCMWCKWVPGVMMPSAPTITITTRPSQASATALWKSPALPGFFSFLKSRADTT